MVFLWFSYGSVPFPGETPRFAPEHFTVSEVQISALGYMKKLGRQHGLGKPWENHGKMVVFYGIFHDVIPSGCD